jgi:putative LysE/RhtB family amino acid efflux pump
MFTSALIGFGLGFLVALQLGPMSAWLIRSTLRSGFRTGAAIGLGVGVIDLLYAAIGVTGVAAALRSDWIRTIAGLIGSIAVSYLGVRALQAACHPATETCRPDRIRPLRAFTVVLGATALNPATIGSWAAVFAGLGTEGRNLPALVIGVGLGSLTWMVLLAAAISLVRHSLGRRGFQIADALSGASMLILAAFVLVRTFTQ